MDPDDTSLVTNAILISGTLSCQILFSQFRSKTLALMRFEPMLLSKIRKSGRIQEGTIPIDAQNLIGTTLKKQSFAVLRECHDA